MSLNKLKIPFYSVLFVNISTVTHSDCLQKENLEKTTLSKTPFRADLLPSILQGYNFPRPTTLNAGKLQEEQNTIRACQESRRLAEAQTLAKYDPFLGDDSTEEDDENSNHSYYEEEENDEELHKFAQAFKKEGRILSSSNPLFPPKTEKFESLDFDTQQHVRDVYLECVEKLQKGFIIHQKPLWESVQNIKKEEKRLELENASLIQMQFASPSQPIDPNLPTMRINYYRDLVILKKQKEVLADLVSIFLKDPFINLQVESTVVELLALFNVFDLDEVKMFISREATNYLSNYKPN